MKRAVKLLVLMLLVIIRVAPGQAQQKSLQDVLFGRVVPMSLKPSELIIGWRQFSPRSPTDTSTLQALMGARAVMPISIFYTRGETVQGGGETYLIAYRVRQAANTATLTPLNVRQDTPNANPPRKLAPDATLVLSLLNVRSLGNLNDIRPFDAQRDVQTPQEQQQEINEASNNNLRQIGLALMQYTQDYDEILPPMRGAATEQQVRRPLDTSGRNSTVQQVLQPYTRSLEVFLEPRTRQPYRGNLSLSRKPLASIEFPARTAAFYEATPAPDGTRGVVFLDGHVERVDKMKWIKVRKDSKIPP